MSEDLVVNRWMLVRKSEGVEVDRAQTTGFERSQPYNLSEMVYGGTY